MTKEEYKAFLKEKYSGLVYLSDIPEDELQYMKDNNIIQDIEIEIDDPIPF